MSVDASVDASAETNQAAVTQPVHEGLYGVVALDHPFALLGLVVVSGVVLLGAHWHAKRKAKKP